MLHLMRTVDRALGYAFIANPSTTTAELTPAGVPRVQQDNRHALFSSAAGLLPDAPKVQDVQERWIDAREEYDEWEMGEWQKEGARAAAEKQQRSHRAT